MFDEECVPTEDGESWIIAEIEDGELIDWEGGGDWWSKDKEACIRESEDVTIFCLETDEVKKRMDQGQTFKVKFTGIGFFWTEPTWDLDYGLDPGEQWLEYSGYEFVEEDQAS